MITGTLMLDIQVEAKNEEDLKRIGAEIMQALKPINGVIGLNEIDSDITDTEEE